MLILSHDHVEAVLATLTTDDLLSLARRSLCTNVPPSTGDATEPARLVRPSVSYTALFMPGWLPEESQEVRSENGGSMGIKVVCVPSASNKKANGLPATTLLLDKTTGAVDAVVNAGALTAVRNTAGSLFATSLLLPKSRPAPKSLVLFGAGLQIRIHIQHFVKAYPTISTVYVVNRTTDGDSRNVQDMKTVLQGLPRTVKHTELLKLGDSHRVAETTRNADIIIAATSSEVPLFQSNDVRGGAVIILIGAYKPTMREVSPELLFRSKVPGHSDPTMASILVDTQEGVRSEAGDVIDALQISDSGSSDKKLHLVEIRALANSDPADEACKLAEEHSLRVYKSVGVAAQDIAISESVVRKARQMGLGQDVAF
ncbi:hypothetical protein BDV98DRAFT_512454 [Pterulicium gracile]|uniref:Ornithine cyclodeaminase n=1 Tax=Pterulicium gracile TaxID=1884261 RepID=A0A5C3QCZ9_9AGAR|nr:hypothetical protein BDV98DRAFT_512454 [Pterula gracilis]